MTREDLATYLKENLTIRITEYRPAFRLVNRITVTLALNEEVVSSDYIDVPLPDGD